MAAGPAAAEVPMWNSGGARTILDSGVQGQSFRGPNSRIQSRPESRTSPRSRPPHRLGSDRLGDRPPGAGIGQPDEQRDRRRLGEHEGAFFSTTTVFGNPTDITVLELTIEAFLPRCGGSAEAAGVKT